MTTHPAINTGITLESARLGNTYQVEDLTSYWHGSFGKCIAIHVDRRIITLHLDGQHPVNVKPEEIRFITGE